jgi:stearoyl-CoA desaturase (Delta-9 desaturase)
MSIVLEPVLAPAPVAATPALASTSTKWRPRVVPTAWFTFIHLTPVLAIFAGVSVTAVALAVLMYFARMFAVAGGYHRLFSHRSYQTSRPFAFLLGAFGCTALQKGPLWWSSVHRLHHAASDTPADAHSPIQRGFWYSHIGWILSESHTETDAKRVRDWSKFPEIVWLDRLHWVPPVLVALLFLFGGNALASAFPGLHTSGWQLLVWGMAISTLVLYHGTWSVNSVMHLWGKRRFDTGDHSRNNPFIAVITLGEGWHNNHHRFMASERQGFYPGELDIAHGILRFFAAIGLVKRLKTPPESILEEGRRRRVQ